MRLKLVMALLALAMATVTFTSCGDDTPDNGLELTSYLDGNYTPTDDTCLLSATINGEKVSERASVTFQTKNLQTGYMALNNVFEEYSSVEIKEFTLVQETEGESVCLTFTGIPVMWFMENYTSSSIWNKKRKDCTVSSYHRIGK